MKRLHWWLPLLLLLPGCPSRPPEIPHGTVELDLPPGKTHAFRGPDYPVAAVVKVKGPSTIYVIQWGAVRAFIRWPGQGEGKVTVPIRDLAVDSKHPVYVGLTIDHQNLIPVDQALRDSLCPVCNNAGEYPPDIPPDDWCCPQN
ncbi:MAG TPA: hypothetical protein VEL05_00735 [Candidatus Acidoferrum sp.]|nr:hypothetical protein [Candidatus Acidoferrum sp.]